METENTNTSNMVLMPTNDVLFEDFKNAVIIVSLLVNVTMLVSWLATVVQG